MAKQEASPGKRVVVYYTNWSQYRPDGAKFLPENIDVRLCSHIVYAFAKIEAGLLAPFEWNDDSTAWSKGMYERVNDLKKQKPGLQTLLAVGGWNMGSQPFTAMVADAGTRQKFISHAIDFLRQRNFDGLDIDWEYPAGRGSPAEDKHRFTLLLQEMRRAFNEEAENSGQPRLLLTVAVAAGKDKIDAAYEMPDIVQYVDFFNLMSYDLNGSWNNETGLNSPLYKGATDPDPTLNQDWAVKYWVKLGVPKNKLVMGLALYGRSFSLHDAAHHGIGAPATGAGQVGQYTREAGFLSYYEIFERLSEGWNEDWSEEHQVPYAYRGNQWVGYDNTRSIKVKVDYIRSQQLGGAMVWDLDLDDFTGDFCKEGKYPLLSEIATLMSTK